MYVCLCILLVRLNRDRKKGKSVFWVVFFFRTDSFTSWNGGTLFCDFLTPLLGFKSEMSPIFLSAFFIHLKYNFPR